MSAPILSDSAVLIINLGTPASLKISSLRVYLREFLIDKRVINLPFWARFLLVYCIIAPFRPFKVKKNYAKIWKDGQSPLAFYTKELTFALQKKFQNQPSSTSVRVDYAMRYGQPSIKNKIQDFAKAGCKNIFVVPLYPQYASATIGSVYEEVMNQLKNLWHLPNVQFILPYFDHPSFFEAQAKQALGFLKNDYDGYLFSYHSLPKDHLQIGEFGKGFCQMTEECCSHIGLENGFCYRAQCLKTTESIRTFLQLPKEKVFNSFQSRLGFKEWIQPYTTNMVKILPQKGVKKLLVFSPSFVTDCVETLEEIGHTEKENFLHAGGTKFDLVPCVNAAPFWVEGLKQMIDNQWSKKQPAKI